MVVPKPVGVQPSAQRHLLVLPNRDLPNTADDLMNYVNRNLRFFTKMRDGNFGMNVFDHADGAAWHIVMSPEGNIFHYGPGRGALEI